MARKVHVQLIDDLTGEDAEETVRFSVDGADYEIDLTAANAAELRAVLSQYVANGRRLRGSSEGRTGTVGIDAHDFTGAIDTDLVLHRVAGPRFVRLLVERTGGTFGPGARACYRLRRDGAARAAGRSPGMVSTVLPAEGLTGGLVGVREDRSLGCVTGIVGIAYRDCPDGLGVREDHPMGFSVGGFVCCWRHMCSVGLHRHHVYGMTG
ncbi:Lsr2 family protein [Arthrobacter oryzae]|uniref:Lsr2 family protein n=1 Tax=Arthrobacter oryzae TaxID=409290 RepID=A0A3N0C506_9MICC|nr:Lsr2 family protein [Arthrobacter oryzae]